LTRFTRRFTAIATAQGILFSALCLSQGESSGTHIWRARQFMAEGKPEAAMLEYKAVLAVEPSNIEAQGNLGVLQFFDNDCSGALPHLTAALTLDPSLARVQALVGICQRRQGHLEEAEHNLTAALPLVADPRIHTLILTNLVEIEAARGDMLQAGVNVAELTKSAPSNPDALYLAYRVYTDLADSARNALTVAAPDSARMHLLTAERFINSGDATMAIQQYQEALAKDPSLLGVHYELGEAILQESVSKDSLDRATAELRLALKEDPRNAGAEAKLGFIEGIRGDSNLAEAHYTRALSLKPDEFNALVGLGNLLRARGENERAAELLSQASRIDAMDDSLHYQLAKIYREMGRKADAEREIKLFATIRGLKAKTSLADQQRMAH
jgi:Tfp pilus assembly protein PilF